MKRIPPPFAHAVLMASVWLGGAHVATADCSSTGGPSTINFYVDPNGLDNPSGGSISAPFRTIQYAATRVRAVNQPNFPPGQDICVYLREGQGGPLKEFVLTGTIALGVLDSGQGSNKIVYRAYGTERPVISGGQPLGAWTLIGAPSPLAGAYQAAVDVNGTSTGLPFGGPFRQFYVNGRRAVRARKPNIGELTVPADQLRGYYREVGWLPPYLPPTSGHDYCDPVPATDPKVLRIRSTDHGGVAAYDDVTGNRPEMFVQMSWLTNIFRVGQVTGPDADGYDRVQLGPGSCANCANPTLERDAMFSNYRNPTTNALQGGWCQPPRLGEFGFHWENVESFLDESGEWYLRYSNDGNATNDVVIYRPRPGEIATTLTTAVAPRLSMLLDIDGSLGTARNIEFRGVTFQYAGWVGPYQHGFVETGLTAYFRPADIYPLETTYPWPQGRIPGAIHVRKAEGIRLVGNTLSHLGGNGIDFESQVTTSEIVGNVIQDVSASGIMLGPGHLFNPSTGNQLGAITVAHNLVEDVGLDYYAGEGIFLTHASGTVIEHNEIRGVRYAGMNLGYGLTGSTPMPGNTLQNNRIGHAMSLLQDGAGIYNGGKWTVPPSVIRENYIHDLERSPATPIVAGVCSAPIAGVYLDGGTDGVQVIRNALTNTHSCMGPPVNPLPPLCGSAGIPVYEEGVFLQRNSDLTPAMTNVCAEGNTFAYGSLKSAAGVGGRYAALLPQKTVGSFVTGLGLRNARNDHEGRLGYWIRVGARPLVVRAIGRLHLPGNSGTHTLRIVRRSDGQELAQATVDLGTGPLDALRFKYATLAVPLTLSANQEYRITSDETSGGDYWYDYDGKIRVEGDGAVLGYTYTFGTTTVDGAVSGQGFPIVNVVVDGRKLVQSVVQDGGKRTNTNWTSEQGMKIEVGPRDLAVFRLGRYFAEGPQGAHTMKAYRKDSAATPLVASATVVMSGAGSSPGADEEGFKYAPLTSNLRLGRSRTYYLTSVEPPSDLWFDYDTQVATSFDVVTSPVYFDGSIWHELAIPGQTYGPVSAVYEPLSRLLPCTGPGTCTTIGTLRSNGWRQGMRITIPPGKTLTVTEIGRYQHATNTGTRTLSIYSSLGTLLASTTLAVGAEAIAVDDDGFKYAALSNPLVLPPGEYFISSDEAAGDVFADYDTQVFPGADVSNVVPAYFDGSQWIAVTGSPGHSYGPLNLIYYPKP